MTLFIESKFAQCIISLLKAFKIPIFARNGLSKELAKQQAEI
jgi:hypothetical protein